MVLKHVLCMLANAEWSPWAAGFGHLAPLRRPRDTAPRLTLIANLLYRSWNDELPADALAIIVNDCGLGQSDVAAVRLTSRVWQRTVDAHLKFLAPACTSLEHVASVATRFPFLRCCDLTRCDTR